MIRTLFILNMKSFGTNFIRTRKKKSGLGMKLLVIFFVLYVLVAFLGLFAALFSSLLEPFYAVGIGWMYFGLLALVVFALCVVSTIFTATAQLFGARDNEFLISMPIKPSAILISRLLVIIVFEYMFVLVASLPAFIIWLAAGYATAAGIVLFIIGIALLPLMALSVALLLAWLLNMVTSRMRHKNIVSLALSIAILLAYLYVYTNIQGYLGELVTRGVELAEAFRKSMPPIYLFGRSIAEASIGDGLMFALWTVLPFAAAVSLLVANYRKLLISNRGSVKTVYRERAVKEGSAISALIRKELAHYWNKPNVVLNTSMGALFTLVLSVMVVIKRGEMLQYIEMIAPFFSDMPTAELAAVMLALLNTMNSLSSSLISLEGKNLWITKSIPVSHKTVLLSKIFTHMMISGLPCLIASFCVAAVFAGGMADWLMLILLPQTLNMLIAIAGLAVNLNFPKLDWTNEVCVVKQGASAMISMFGSMGVIIGLGLSYAFLLNSIISLTVFLWLCAVIFTIVSAIIIIWLMDSGLRKLEEL